MLVEQQELPEGWEVRKLGSVTKITMGQSPSYSLYNRQEKGLPFFQGSTNFGYRFPKLTTWIQQPLKTAFKDDILLSIRAPAGEVNIATHHCCIGRGLAAIKSVNIENNFLYFSLLLLKDTISLKTQGSTFEAINRVDIDSLNILYPPLTEINNMA